MPQELDQKGEYFFYRRVVRRIPGLNLEQNFFAGSDKNGG